MSSRYWHTMVLAICPYVTNLITYVRTSLSHFFVLRAFGKQCILSKHFGCKERHFFKHVGYESKAFCAKLSKHGISWMRIKGMSSNVSDVHQGFAQHCGFESRHFFQTFWMRINTFCSNTLDEKQRIHSNILDTNQKQLVRSIWMHSKALF